MNIKGFELASVLGQGSMGTVYKAYEKALDRHVAIKVLFPELTRDPILVQRFNNEARIAAKLIHPNIIPIYHWGETEGLPYFCMEYFEGKNLSAYLNEKGPFPPSVARDLILQCLEGLQFAHDQNVLHRDIKPENLLYSESLNLLKIVDFGLAKILDETRHLT